MGLGWWVGADQDIECFAVVSPGRLQASRGQGHGCIFTSMSPRPALSWARCGCSIHTQRMDERLPPTFRKMLSRSGAKPPGSSLGREVPHSHGPPHGSLEKGLKRLSPMNSPLYLIPCRGHHGMYNYMAILDATCFSHIYQTRRPGEGP